MKRMVNWFDPALRQPLSERNKAVLWIFVALVIFLMASAVSDPLPPQVWAVLVVAPTETAGQIRPTPTPSPTATEIVLPTPTKTPLPAYMLENYDDTNGVVVGTVMLVIIILLGTLAGIRVRRSQN